MPAINKAIAALRVLGDQLDPAEITALLGAEPTRAHRKGDALPGKNARIAKTGMWRIEAEPFQPSNLDEQVRRLLSSLNQDLTVWASLHGQYQLSFFCGWFMGEGNEGEDISPDTLVALGSRGIALALDIYSPDEDLDE